jgi:hypothetical protein
MELNLENKPPSFYRLEKLLFEDNAHWFYLYSINYQSDENSLLIEIGPNNDREDKRRWLFSNVTTFNEYREEDETILDFPKMIFGIDLNEPNIVVIACDDIEYSFKIKELPERV